ncbi:DUF2087 domain-containing protein [Pseudalkalibacillus berkeleyi]|uniref:DUF2087 domain-containing protein n=1 Tax=Pseudalkalibacillus berkeleyi TaxID=1069813 RepID=A0ABS9GXN9_9BACL|nr:DUF2087 domain-containing protein [Pseudalkalibacillus berkeleyi]MCF6136135.1 DUF2087 domain-containing protein [Pseudalkalibacillus berkeleyi]
MDYQEDRFWDASSEDLKRGYTYEHETEQFTCLICGKAFQKGIIYKWTEDMLMEAEKAIKQHIKDEHGSVLEYLLTMNKKYTGLTEVQRTLLSCFKDGQSDKEIAKQLDVGSTSTIRTHRFKLKEKEKQAKVFLAIMDLLKKTDQQDDLVQIHKGATQVDERYAITTKEREKVLNTYFNKGVDGPLTKFPSKEKRKIIVLQQIIRRFDSDNKYTEMEVNEVLKPIIDDFVTVRRYLIEYGFLDRSKDCSEYWVKK